MYKIKSISVTTRLVILLFLAIGLNATALAQVKVVNVQVSVNGAQDGLDVNTPADCPNTVGAGKGCSVADKGKHQRINVHLVGNRQCTYELNDAEHTGRWELYEAHLGGKDSAAKPGAWGGLDAEVLADFNAEAASGKVIPWDQNDSLITFLNYNNHAYDIWWKVSARCMDGGNAYGAAIETDPRVRNKGT
jgi:hypothetical protein